MKYCPYCGASVMDVAAFCTECGEHIQPPDAAPPASPPVKAKKEKRRKPRSKRKKADTPAPIDAGDTGYDGYYRDVPSLDSGGRRERLDPAIVKRVVLLCIGAVVLIGLSLALLLVF